jgi:hypothetical protein
MTRANSLEPPRLATWLLEQFYPVLENAPLAGDLIESFKQGRSSSWYWRQVFGAILIALPNLLRRQWGCLAYAIGCSGLISASWFFMFSNSGRGSALSSVFTLYAKGYGIQWPWSLVYQIAFITVFQVVMVAFALGGYAAFFRILKPRNMLQALMVVFVVLASSNVALTFLSVIINVSRFGLLVGWVLVSTPTIGALLLGMWKTNPGATSRPISA